MLEAGVAFHIEMTPKFGKENCFPRRRLVRNAALEPISPLLVILRVEHIENLEVRQFFLGVFQGLSPGWVYIQERAIWGGALDQVGCILKQIPALLFAMAQ